MTVLLVLFTLILFLAVDHFVQKRQSSPAVVRSAAHVRSEQPAQTQVQIPDGVSLATNHTWMKTNRDGTVTIGLDEFLSRIMGAIKTITIPQSGSKVLSGSTSFGLGVHGRSLHIALPASGHVVELNTEALNNPSLVLNDPYGAGWLMRINSGERDLAASRQYLVRRPIEWLREQAALVRDFFVMNMQQGVPAMSQEGGLPTEGVLQQFQTEVWKEFGNAFTVLHPSNEVEVNEARK